MRLTSYKRVKDQWILDLAVSQRDWDEISVGDKLYYPANGREGIVSAKMDAPSSKLSFPGSEYLSKGIRAAFPAIPADRILWDPWTTEGEGAYAFRTTRPPTVTETATEVAPQNLAEGAEKAAKRAGEAAVSLWDRIPSWAKWGSLGMAMVYMAGPTIGSYLGSKRREVG